MTLMIASAAPIHISMFRTLVKWSYNTTMATRNPGTAFQAVHLALVVVLGGLTAFALDDGRDRQGRLVSSRPDTGSAP